MKKSFPFYLFLFSLVIFASCSRRSHPATARHYGSDTAYIPFTKNLKDLVDRNNLDIKKIQFFIDQKLIMKRSLGAQKVDIKSGVIVFENGEYMQEIILPAYTPGVCERDANNQLHISFETAGNTVSFAALGENNNYYRLLGHNWDQRLGTTEIVYDNQNYKVQCATCTNAGDAKLVVRKSQMEKMQNATKVLEGHRVDN
jgi:hypothetical protein